MNADRLQELLIESKYPKGKIKYLHQGFKVGFSLRYEGPQNVQKLSPNLKIRIGSKVDLWNKVMVVVKAGWYVGPFEQIPFANYIQSPIGLVPKHKGTKTRLIFHLSYPKGTSESVNAKIPYEFCKVTYPDFQDTVLMCANAGKNCTIAKSDMAMAFRHVPLMRKYWRFLCLKAQHPVTGKWYFFFDKCLPFGSSISCKIFQDISDAIAHIVRYKTGKENLNYLDDYFFIHLIKALCNGQVETFLWVCNEIKFPVLLEKTVWDTTVLIFLGLLIDTVEQVIRIPKEKIEKAMSMIDYFLAKKNGSVTIHEVQKLCGTLNFLCKCIVPGRVFLHRMYSLMTTKDHIPVKQHHHTRLTQENKQDLMVWRTFLMHPDIFCQPFMDMVVITSEDIDMYSDASGKIGIGSYCGKNWCFGFWSKHFLETKKPSIDYLELYGLTVEVLLWIKKFNKEASWLHAELFFL